MPRLDLDSRRRVLVLRQLGYLFSSITERLRQEDIIITSRSLQQLEKKYVIRAYSRICQGRNEARNYLNLW